MSDITFVCCYNDNRSFEDLVNCINSQNCDSEIIGIDNSSYSFMSCSSAFNSILNNIETKYVAFIHQDIIINDVDTVNKMLSYLDKVEVSDLLGVAGARLNNSNKRIVLSNITHGVGHEQAGESLVGFQECMTLDECLVFGYSEYFINNPFDEILCDNWHLYFVEQCLRTQSHGGHVYVCDLPLYHKSKGNISYKYVNGFFKLCRKYRKNFDYITTCCASSKTDFIKLFFTCLIILGSVFKHKIVK